ncbi:MAG TPA: M48 family metalloprotease [Chthoniobacteraceae bacterium]|jgi:Zn-dependent protease with chaperone function|nr:M48 family metalloprotease [Chthoniobacteraceae bacterium]
MILLLIQAVLVFVACALGQAVALWVALRPWRRAAPDAHWSERARLAWCGRLLNSLGPLCAGALTAWQAQRFAPHPYASAVLGFAAFLGGTAAILRPARRILRRPVTWRSVAVEYAVTFLLLRAGFVTLILMALVLARYDHGPAAIAIVVGGFLAVLALQLGAALPFARLFRVLTKAPAKLVLMVAEVAEGEGMRMPAVYLLHWEVANAYAFINARAVAFTPKCLELMTDDEVRAVVAHELAHLRESFRQKFARSAGLFLFFPYFTAPAWIDGLGALGFLGAALILWLGSRFLRGFSQRMERRADAAALASAAGGETYARALEKIYEYNLVPAVMRGKAQTHPHLYDRLLAAGMQPAYPRPVAPKIWLLLPALAIVLAMSQTPRLLHLRRKFHVPIEEKWER